MRLNTRLRMCSFLFLFCFLFFSPPAAPEDLPAIVKRIAPSVVVISTYDKEGKALGQGSGFFISQSGDIITNRHVLIGAARAEVKTAQTKTYPITSVVAEHKEADIIRVSADIPPDLARPLSVSNSIPEVGERVVVIGSPLGLEQTVTDGIVSAVREIRGFGKIIQISASVSPGSSGSPVVNMKGEVIGVATFQVIEGQSLNFAIPGQRAARLIPWPKRTLAEWQTGRLEEWRASAEGLYLTGVAYAWAAEYDKALPYFEKAVTKNPRYAEAYNWIGCCNLQSGRHAQAIEAYKQAIRIQPDDAVAHCSLGVAYVALGRYAQAIEALKQAIRIKPDLAEAHFGLGVAYGKLGRYAEAIEGLKQAIRIKPDLAEAHSNLGIAYVNLARYAEAIEPLKQAIRINPHDAEAYCGLGLAYGALGRYADEIKACKQAIRINPDYPEAHCTLGVAYYELGRHAEAIEACKQAIRIKPDYAEAHFNLGLSYLELQDKGSALNEYKILKEMNTDLANDLFNAIYK
jgi:tetratricopeptide (TPR) repeat protein